MSLSIRPVLAHLPAPITLAAATLVGTIACTERPSDDDTEEPSDVGIDTDPTAIEGPEIGEEQIDNAKAVEPGPAELEVGTPQAEPEPR